MKQPSDKYHRIFGAMIAHPPVFDWGMAPEVATRLIRGSKDLFHYISERVNGEPFNWQELANDHGQITAAAIHKATVEAEDEYFAKVRNDCIELLDAPEPDRTFSVFSWQEIQHLKPPPWLIHGIIPQQSLAVLYGPPGSGKSFLALDWGMHISTKRLKWNLLNTFHGPVVYVAAEGAYGMGPRTMAWLTDHDDSPHHPFIFIPEPPQIRNRGDVKCLIDTIKLHLDQNPSIIILDTMARCLVGGNENDAKDIGEFISGCSVLQKTFDSTVLIVHHTGKDSSRGERGSSALRGAADTTMSVTPIGPNSFNLNCEKQKEDEPFEQLTLELLKHELGDGKSSCTVRVGTWTVSKTNNRSLQTLSSLLSKCEKSESASSKVWRKHAIEAGYCKRSTFFANRSWLVDNGYVEKYPQGGPGHWRPLRDLHGNLL